MVRCLILLVRGYRKFLPPLKVRAHCVYTSTCSRYAVEALKKHGALKGI